MDIVSKDINNIDTDNFDLNTLNNILANYNINNVDKIFNLVETNENFNIYGNPIFEEYILIEYIGKLTQRKNTEDKNFNIYFNYGYGNLWESKESIKMYKVLNNTNKDDKCNVKFYSILYINFLENINFCFVDSENNCDLNSSSNYYLEVLKKDCLMSKTDDDTAEIQIYNNLSFFEKILKSISETFFKFILKIGKKTLKI